MTLVLLLVLVVIPFLLLRVIRSSLKDAQERAMTRSFISVELDDEIRRKLLPGEEVWGTTRKHPVVLAGFFAAWLPCFIGAVILPLQWQVKAIVIAIVAIIAIIKVALYRRFIYVLTNRRVLNREGLVRSALGQSPHMRITDTSRRIGYVSQILSLVRVIDVPYGTIRIENAGQNQAISELENVPMVDAFDQMISERIIPPAQTQPSAQQSDGT